MTSREPSRAIVDTFPDCSLHLIAGLWLTCSARSAFDPGLSYLHRVRCSSPRAAVNIMRIHLRTLGAVLHDTAPDEGLWHWVDQGYQEALASLGNRQPVTVEFFVAQATWTWTARPVLFLPTAGHSSDCPNTHAAYVVPATCADSEPAAG
jgi:hypothetical protein